MSGTCIFYNFISNEEVRAQAMTTNFETTINYPKLEEIRASDLDFRVGLYW